MATEYTNIDPANPPQAQTKKIWVTFFILVGITAVEFMFAFFFPKDLRTTLITIYVVLTLFKAFFIVSEFMHLGHEVKALVYSIVLPMMFVVWLIVAMIMEARYYYDSNYNYDSIMIKTAEEEKSEMDLPGTEPEVEVVTPKAE